MKTHSAPDRNFPCDECNKSYKRNCELLRHKKVGSVRTVVIFPLNSDDSVLLRMPFFRHGFGIFHFRNPYLWKIICDGVSCRAPRLPGEIKLSGAVAEWLARLTAKREISRSSPAEICMWGKWLATMLAIYTAKVSHQTWISRKIYSCRLFLKIKHIHHCVFSEGLRVVLDS